jgi:hypothetical protein
MDYSVMEQQASIRRILLTTALVLLTLLDVSTIYGAIHWIVVGNEFASVGIPDIGAGLAAVQLPVIMILLWVTFRVWQTLRG